MWLQPEDPLHLNAGHVADFAGVKVDDITMQEALQKMEELIAKTTPSLIVTPNPEIIVKAQHDEELKEIVNNASLRLPDGISMVVVSKLLGFPLIERVTGIDFMNEAIKLAHEKKYRIFLLGGTQDVIEKAVHNIEALFPDVQIVGFNNGYFNDFEELQIITKIKNSRPHIIFAGLGAGKQEKWLAKHKEELAIPISMGVGGSFDVVSGIKKRAPLWVQRYCIEWLYRLVTEPGRWQRQLALPKFLWLVFKSRLSWKA